MKRLCTVRFLPMEIEVQAEEGCLLLDVALKAGIDIGHSCGGNATCGTCQVRVGSDIHNLPPRTELEQEMADTLQFQAHERLACQLPVYDGLLVTIP